MTDQYRELLSLPLADLSVRWMVILLHFLWQGTVIGLAVVLVARLLRKAAARVRYALYWAGLVSLPICIAVTAGVVDVPGEYLRREVSLNSSAGILPQSDVGSHDRVDPDQSLFDSSVVATALSDYAISLVDTSAGVISQHDNSVETTSRSAPMGILSRCAPWISVTYCLCVIGFLFRLTTAHWGGHRLLAHAELLTDTTLRNAVSNQASRLGMRVVPVVAYCERVAVPTVIGIVRPMVLMPVSIMNGLSVDEFSAIVSHEFSHIRRYDPWMNLLQRLIESFLFFHPVVWLFSHRLSVERELCCDELVVAAGHSPVNYAGALLRMAELCVRSQQIQPTALAATGADGDEFERRIQRLLNMTERTHMRLTRTGIVAALVLIVAVAAVPAAHSLVVEREAAGPRNSPIDTSAVVAERDASVESQRSQNALVKKAHTSKVAPNKALSPLEFLQRLRERDRQFDNRSLKGERTWRTLQSPRDEANWVRHNIIRFGEKDPGIPQGLPDNFEQPHRIQYLWTQRGGTIALEHSADLEKPVDVGHSRMERHQKQHADRWQTLLPLGIGFSSEIKSISSIKTTDDGYIVTGMLNAHSAVIDGRQNSFTLQLDHELIIRRAELKFHVYDFVVVTSGKLQSGDNVPATAKRGEFWKYYVRNKGEPLGERNGTAKHFKCELLNISKPLTDEQFKNRAQNNLLDKTAELLNQLPVQPDALTQRAESATEETSKTENLKAAAETIRSRNACLVIEPPAELVAALRLLEESADADTANSLALELTNHQMEPEVNNVRFWGFRILAARDRESTLKFLKATAESQPKKDRERTMELYRAVERRVPGVPVGKIPATKPSVQKPTAAKPSVNPPVDETRPCVAVAFGEPIYLDQLDPKTMANNFDVTQRQNYRGRRLLREISRRATNDYRRREKLEITTDMKQALWETILQPQVPDKRSNTFCEEERYLMAYGSRYGSLMDWVLTKSLYERYGGRVGYGSLGLWLAPDGRNQLIRDYQKSGEIQIRDAEIEQAMWKEATKPNFADAYPKGERLKQLMTHPPHIVRRLKPDAPK